jgi:hypothetical protein
VKTTISISLKMFNIGDVFHVYLICINTNPGSMGDVPVF